jgi:hypothetical protein
MARSTKKDDLIGSFEERPFPVSRTAGIDTVVLKTPFFPQEEIG